MDIKRCNRFVGDISGISPTKKEDIPVIDLSFFRDVLDI
jgi:hypothetical protein